ncbi:unnamed protein product [Owenia fusiformis]|uniref:Uncharacterized protein n=2 Tax=Owenia fusiformis TaxID=6347 RepID=A0A8J1XMC0_OWEFU|nr:unnamed protein product [Owenia fusiformis]
MCLSTGRVPVAFGTQPCQYKSSLSVCEEMLVHAGCSWKATTQADTQPTTTETTKTEPTTTKPTTIEPITTKSITTEPTTNKQTTAELITIELTTAKPTTSEHTTAKPTTIELTTTERPTTKPATTELTTTAPITIEASTTTPITSAPTTTDPATAELTISEQNTVEHTTAIMAVEPNTTQNDTTFHANEPSTGHFAAFNFTLTTNKGLTNTDANTPQASETTSLFTLNETQSKTFTPGNVKTHPDISQYQYVNGMYFATDVASLTIGGFGIAIFLSIIGAVILVDVMTIKNNIIPKKKYARRGRLRKDISQLLLLDIE